MSSDNVDSKVVEDVIILSEVTSIVEDTLVDSTAPIIDEVHTSSDSTSDDVNEIVESNIPAVHSKSFEFSCADYWFMVVPIELSSNECSEFLVMIQQMIPVSFSFTSCLEFTLKSNIPLLEELDVCHLRHLIYFIFLSLGVTPKVPTACHLSVAHDDDIIRQLANCDENYKFSVYPYSYIAGIYN